MSKKVCMFVWNHFTNDARVFRECSALSEAGYEVDLVAIHDWKDEKLLLHEQHKNGFEVFRVKNRIPGLHKYAGKMKKLFVLGLVGLIMLLFLGIIPKNILAIVSLPIFAIMAGIVFAMTKTKLPKLLTRAFIFFQMVHKGHSKRYDFYHSNDLNTLLQGVLSAKLFRRRKLIYDSHEVQTSRTGYNSRIYGIMERFLLRFVDEMIAENHTRAKYNENLYGIYPNVVHNYPIPSRPETSSEVNLHGLLGLPETEPILLYQGGIQIGRGLEKIVDAVPLIERGTVVFIGDGRLKRDLERMVCVKGLSERVMFIPKVPVDELLHYTRNAYLGFQVLNNVCFNHYSASSNKLFEYMMSGVPVIACSFPEIQKVVENENIGICVDSHDPASIAEGVNYLLNHPALRKVMSRNCLTAREKYNWMNEKQNFIDIYESA
ncbi:glycosyltransferase [Peribacillus sp. SCS-155]|uniref:glycosyltransferase n=1 Tax=Peribacillus sedimenti TaxID=3115297 RepID=UPI00390649D8